METPKGIAAGLCVMGVFAATLAAGCGSSSKAGSSGTSSSAATHSDTTNSTPSGSTVSSNGTTPAGTSLTTGTPALVDYQPGAAESSPKYRLQVTAVSIKQGSQSDLNGVELEKAQQGLTPYYVTLRVRNEGSGNAAAEQADPIGVFQTTDDRGSQGQELTILGTYRPCESHEEPKQFTKGVEYTTCNVYLVGKGGSIVSVSWGGNGADSYSEHPIVWRPASSG